MSMIEQIELRIAELENEKDYLIPGSEQCNNVEEELWELQAIINEYK